MRQVGYWFLLLPALASADTIRCGGYLVNTGDSQSRVLDICGEPQSAQQDGFIEQVARWNPGAVLADPGPPNPYPARPGYETETRRILPVYKWEYNLGHGTFLKILTFYGDTLVDIADGPRQ